MSSTLLTARRRFLPLSSLLLRREYRGTALETRGMRDFPVLASRISGVDGATLSSYCAEALAYRIVRQRSREFQVRVEERTLAYAESLYVLARALRPKVTVETGVCTGITTGYLLSALRKNGDGGRLVSIDLPMLDPGGMVNADGVRDRAHVRAVEETGLLADPALRNDPSLWRLHLGDAKQLLPTVLEDLGGIDGFYHDSEHSYAHMSFEFAQAWPHLRPGGLLISDDINFSEGARRAWREFVAGKADPNWQYFGPRGNRGVLRKLPG